MITRYRGDTQNLKIILNQDNTLVDLDSITKVEIGINKGESVLVIECTKDIVPTTGVVFVPFTETDLDTVGSFPFDIQVTWTDTTKTTFLIDKFKIVDDINKT